MFVHYMRPLYVRTYRKISLFPCLVFVHLLQTGNKSAET